MALEALQGLEHLTPLRQPLFAHPRRARELERLDRRALEEAREALQVLDEVLALGLREQRLPPGQLADLRAKGAKDVNAELLDLRREQFALRLQRATGQSPKPDQFGKVRKNIARLKTVQAEQRAKKTGDKA